MKIVRFTAENIKKLKVVEITPEGNLVQITGANGQGKTSVLDAIYYALAGTADIPSQPVRKGAGKGRVTLDLGEFSVTRRFVEGGGTTLAVAAANGARFPSPQSMLDELLGKLSFDPLAFTRKDAKAQLETLRKLVDLGDVDIDALDQMNKGDYDRRQIINREAKSLQAQLDAMPVIDGLPEKAIDISAMVTKLSSAAEHNSTIESEIRERVTNAEYLRNMEAQISNMKLELAKLEARAEGMRADVKNYELLPLAEKIDTVALAQEIEGARITNQKIDRRDRRRVTASELKDKQAEADELTEQIKARTKVRSDAIASAAMPLEGLSFGDGAVVYNGIPLDQASDAEQLRISVAIAMAANPKLRVLRIKDGSLLDENSLQIIADMAKDKDYQVWIERVDTTGKVGVVMEDGEVKGSEEAKAKKKKAAK